MPDAPIVLSVSTWQQPMPPDPGPSGPRSSLACRDRRDARRSPFASRGRRLHRRGQDELRPRARGDLPARVGPRSARRWTTSNGRGARPTATTVCRADGYYRNVFDTDAMTRLPLDPGGRRATGSWRCAASIRSPSSTTRRRRPSFPRTACSSSTACSCADPRSTAAGTFGSGSRSTRSSRCGEARNVMPRGGGIDRAEALHRERYLASERLYVEEVGPRSLAEVVVDNRDFDRPRLLRPMPG